VALESAVPSRLLDLAVRWVGVPIDVLERGYLAALVRVRKNEVFLRWRKDQVGIYGRDMDSIRRLADSLATLDPYASCGAFDNDITEASVNRFHPSGLASIISQRSFVPIERPA
jgi:hypothetical protein